MSFGNSNWGFSSSGGGGGGTPITGGGTPNFIAKFTPTGTVINNSLLFDNGVTLGLGTITPNASALLDVTSTTQGFLTPRMTQTERNAIGTPATGLFIYNTTSSHFNFWDGAIWQVIESSTLTSDTLGQVLAAGNTTGGLPIVMTSGDTINFSVGSGGILNSLSTSVNQTWNLPDASGTIALLSNIPSTAITNNVIPQGTGTGITDGTWQFSGNDILPTTTGSNIGDATHRIGTIFMASVFDYASNISWINGVNTNMTFTTTGRLGIGTATPATKLHVSADDASSIIASARYSSDALETGFFGAKARGTQASPSAILLGDHISGLASNGHDGTSFSATNQGKISFYAAENFTPTAKGTNVGIFTVAIGTTTVPLERVTVTSEGLTGFGILAPTAKVHIVGISALVSDYALKIQDSTTLDLFAVHNSGQILAGNNGTANLFVGQNSGLNITTALYTTAFGVGALQSLVDGNYNTAVGVNAGDFGTTGDDNSYFGFNAHQRNVTGSRNSIFGAAAGTFNVGSGSDNVFIGNTSGYFNNDTGDGTGTVGGNRNTFVGASSGQAARGSDCVFLGCNAGSAEVNNDRFIVGSNSGVILYGNIASTALGLGNINPLARWHVTGMTNSITQRLEPTTTNTEDTSGDATSTTGVVTSDFGVITTTTDSVQTIVATITYRKTAGAGVGAIGQGTTLTISTSVQNIGGVLTLDTTQNDYTGTVNAITGASAIFFIVGTTVVVRVTGVLLDTIIWNVISRVNTVS